MKVKLYTTPTCSYCHVAKRYLKEKGIKFTEYNVMADRRKAMEMVSKSGQQGVPVLDFNGTVVIGFDRKKIDRLISSH